MSQVIDVLRKKAETIKLLDISLVHLPRADSVELMRNGKRKDAPPEDQFIVNETTHGWDVYCFSGPGSDYKRLLKAWNRRLGAPTIRILCAAAELGYHWVRFDADGTRYPDIPEFKW